tara:strand:- start:118 stop:624 length:507 start_codon:yes stop_codon:yes gene_type:complete
MEVMLYRTSNHKFILNREYYMKKLGTILILALLGFPLATFAAEHEVKMLNQGTDGLMVFEPGVLQIQPGDSVTFKATNPGHNAASMEGMIPAGAESWDSGMSKDITVIFSKEGTYVYQCTPHLMLAMVGIITVGDPTSNLEQVRNASIAKKSAFLVEKDRLNGYLQRL